MSTEPAADSPAFGVRTAFHLDRPWRLDDRVAIRPEPFGAMLYHFGTRRLSFIKSTTLLSVLRHLAGHPTARAACAAAGVIQADLPTYRRALFAEWRQPQNGGACRSCGSFDSCRGGCMAAKFFTGLPLDGTDPECVRGHGEAALAAAREIGAATVPRPSADHSHRRVMVTIGRRPPPRSCDENPLAGFVTG